MIVDPSGIYDIDPELSGIWVLDPASGERWRVAPFGGAPTWSPDGTKIAFDSPGQIFNVGADGTGLTQITFEGLHYFPSWSFPESGSLMTTLMTSGRSAQTAAKRGSSEWVACLAGARWGRSSFASGIFATQSEVFTLDASGANPKQLTFTQTDDRHPVFSPDGAQIAFSGQMRTGDSWE